jgi:uncharacterized membrane-anchored protein YjiN (DUF445 family)
MSVNVDSPIAAIDGGDLARLRRMKLTATGFLVAAAVIYAATFSSSGGGAGVLGFVRAAAEAGMVGALADWFAVTALFRRPLHLPIPHTAIIPSQKDEIASKLGTFVTANFLTPELLVHHLDEAQIVRRIGARLCEPVYADRLGAEVAHAVSVGLQEVDTDRLVGLAFDLAQRDAARRSYAPVLGQLLERAVEGQVQRPLLELLTTRTLGYVRDNRDELRAMFLEYLDNRNWLIGLVISERRMDRLIDVLLRELEAVERDPHHPLRRSVDGMLTSLATNLQNGGAAAARIDLVARQMLADETYQAPLQGFLAEAVESFRGMLDEEGGAFAGHVSRLIQDTGNRIATDPDFEAFLEGWLRRVVIHAVRDYGDELTVLIRRTVAGWDPTSASRRIEVAVGRDLQFIRINGTVVGALAGLAIHLVTVLAT